MPKRTYQPKRRRRVRRHGYRARMAVKKSGKTGPVIKRRKAKGRKQLAVRAAGVKR